MSFEEDISDTRLIWVTAYHDKHTRLPLPKLVRVHSERQKLAIVGGELPRYSFRADAGPKSGQVLTSYDMVCELYSLLTEEIKSCFVIKPYRNMGWNTKQRFIDRLGVDKVSNEPDFYRFLSRARIIVCTYPQTTFSEAMASGLPSILFYPVHLWETIPEMAALLGTLRAAKIVFDDPQAAAIHIKAVWDDAERWWNSADVVHARNEFQRQALHIGGDAMRQWKSVINSIIAEA